MDTVILLLLLVPALSAANQTIQYSAARDYLSVTSENYPDSYPGSDSWRWQWSVESGLWAVVFTDFQLACRHHDRLVISDSLRKLTFTCGNPPFQQYAYFIEGPHFTMQLVSGDQPDTQSRGFSCQVLYGSDKGTLQSKVDDMKSKAKKKVPDSNKDGGALHTDTIMVLLLLIIVPLVVIIVIGGVVALLRRRHMQQSTNTSLHLNIGAIRRDSSVSYTRHGNGPPAGARSRLDSAGSLSPDHPRPQRPAKRSDSSASWAARAEMNTSFRHGSCSSQGQGGSTAPNLYTPCPGENPGDESLLLDHPVYRGFRAVPKSTPPTLGCPLSTICEESGGLSGKLSTTLPVPHEAEQSSLTGYLLMTSCSTNYVNCGHD
ncbi:uncharacterized protein LOC143302235 isoform X2 [Babylonia areolata]|uniref:uncharacterized protein LOC143302235 isoform X2 n=1 Tax=Babylonia areolata TaxID=304850 RepID=UPI003FD31E86